SRRRCRRVRPPAQSARPPCRARLQARAPPQRSRRDGRRAGGPLFRCGDRPSRILTGKKVNHGSLPAASRSALHSTASGGAGARHRAESRRRCCALMRETHQGKEMRMLKLAGASLCAFSLSIVVASGADPIKIRASWIVAPSDWTPMLLEKPELMRNQGKSYVFEPVRYAGTPAVITAMANNEVELGNLAFSSLAIAIQNAGLDDLRVIGDQFRDADSASHSNQSFVLTDSASHRVEDLKGKS